MLNLTEDEKKRIDPHGVEWIISKKRELLNVWSLPNYEKAKLHEEIKELEKLIK